MIDETTRLLDILVGATQEARDPIDFPIQLSTTMPWMIDYHNRKHLFIYCPVQLVLSLEDYGTSTLFANTWHTLDFPAGMRVFATNQTNPIYAFIKATDEPTLLDYNTVITATISGTPTVNVTALPTSATGTPTAVAASATSVTLLAANANRKGASVYNDSTAIMFLTLNATTTASLYTTQVPPNTLYEVPVTPVYTGAISALWASATGNARITEMT